MSDNIYLPELARITHIKEEIGGERAIKTYRVEPVEGGSLRARLRPVRHAVACSAAAR